MRAVPTPALLAGVTLLAAILRLWGIRFGLPHTLTRPDEETITAVAGAILLRGPNPQFFRYPTLFPYLLAALVKVCLGAAPAAGAPAPYLISRAVSAVMGTASVPLLFAAARRLFSNETALAASALLAVAFLHVRDSHFGVTDVPATFMILLAFWATVSLPIDGSHWWNAALAGGLCGLAAATKYNALLIVAPLLVRVAQRPAGSARPRAASLAGIVLTIIAFVVIGFAAGTPYAILDRRAFVRDFLAERVHLAGGHGLDEGLGWMQHLTFSLRYGLTLPLLLAAIAGGVLLPLVGPRSALVVLAFPLCYYTAMGSGRTTFVRYMTPLVPFAALLAGVAIDAAARAAARAAGRPALRVWVIVGLTVMVGFESARRSVALDRLLTVPDSRVLAAAWVRNRYPGGVSVYQSGDGYAHAQLDPEGAYPDAVFDDARGTFVFLGTPSPGPRLVIVPVSRLKRYTAMPSSLPSLIASDYKLVQTIDVENPASATQPVFDQLDAFFVPLTGFDRFTRPGPSIEIYERQR